MYLRCTIFRVFHVYQATKSTHSLGINVRIMWACGLKVSVRYCSVLSPVRSHECSGAI